MKKISRRNLIRSSLIAATATVMTPSMVSAESKKYQYIGGLVSGKTNPLPYESIAGFLSKEQLTPHHEAHYGGALRGYLKLDEKLQAGDFEANGFGAMQRGRTQKSNSVLLHELYFSGMTAGSTKPSKKLVKAIEKRFGSWHKWADAFQASAKSASGWALLVQDQLNGKLYNIISDKHADGVLWNATPLIAIDVYEHAYYVDYQNNKKQYIEKYMQHINWDVINKRFSISELGY